MSAEYTVTGSIAVITMNNPPVNGLGHATRSALVEQIKWAEQDDKIRVIIIIGGGKVFSGGADIKEFNSPKAFLEPSLHSVIQVIENSSKPVVAAIHAVCMGGGLELALGCHYRVASAGAQIALPEVKLGLLPGAGGTQRLPRVVGWEMALNMIVSGVPVAAEKLAHCALFDEMIEGDLLQGAMTFAENIADIRPLPRIRDMFIDHPNSDTFLQIFRDTVQAKAGAFPAPLKCVEAVAAALTENFDDGLQVERDLFLQLLQSSESKALRHAFFAERAASKLPDVPEDTPTRMINTAAVVGAGTMGGGIAMNFANVGIPVQILDMKQETLDRGLATIRQNYENTFKKGKLTQEQFDQRVALITGTMSYDAIAQADIVIEAVFEDLAVKEQVFKKLDEVMKPGAILASNTSTLDLDLIAGFTRRPEDVVGTHFFSPANVMKLLEIVRGKRTAKEVLATVLLLSKKIKKTGVISGVCDGFIGNRMLEQYTRQAGFLLEEGCTPEQVDKAIEKLGFAMGPFRMSDLAGNDISWAIRQRRYISKPDVAYSKVADLLCESGRFGQKTGAGWYDYKAGERVPYPSQLVNDMINQHSADSAIERRAISDQEITERLIFALVNEGARILEEGIAIRASDIDMVYLSGYGFPSHLGGPMFYADTLGLAKVMTAMKQYSLGRHGEAWTPAPLLIKLASEGNRFNQ